MEGFLAVSMVKGGPVSGSLARERDLSPSCSPIVCVYLLFHSLNRVSRGCLVFLSSQRSLLQSWGYRRSWRGLYSLRQRRSVQHKPGVSLRLEGLLLMGDARPFGSYAIHESKSITRLGKCGFTCAGFGEVDTINRQQRSCQGPGSRGRKGRLLKLAAQWIEIWGRQVLGLVPSGQTSWEEVKRGGSRGRGRGRHRGVMRFVLPCCTEY